jgi:hypothetical protein
MLSITMMKKMLATTARVAAEPTLRASWPLCNPV